MSLSRRRRRRKSSELMFNKWLQRKRRRTWRRSRTKTLIKNFRTTISVLQARGTKKSVAVDDWGQIQMPLLMMMVLLIQDDNSIISVISVPSTYKTVVKRQWNGIINCWGLFSLIRTFSLALLNSNPFLPRRTHITTY